MGEDIVVMGSRLFILRIFTPKTAEMLARAIQKRDSSEIKRGPGIPRDLVELATVTYKEVEPLLDNVDEAIILVKPTWETGDSDYRIDIEDGTPVVRIWHYYNAYKLPDADAIVFNGLKCYSNAVGCHSITDFLFYDQGQWGWERVWRRVEPKSYREALQYIVPKVVLDALDRGIDVLRQGDVWFVKQRRGPRHRKKVEREKAVLFGSHEIEGLIVYAEAARRLYVEDAVAKHKEHGELKLPGWWLVTWNRRPADFIVFDDRIEVAERRWVHGD